MKVLIIMVDRYGYLGREHHPTTNDIGKIVDVLKMERCWAVSGEPVIDEKGELVPITRVCDGCRGNGYVVCDQKAAHECPRCGGKTTEEVDPAKVVYEGTTFEVFYCVREDGTLVDLVDHEIQYQESFQEMRLCETRFVFLKPQAYLFTVDPKCENCLRAAKEAWVPEGGAMKTT